jgi:pyrroloquinoline-quinone synthase
LLRALDLHETDWDSLRILPELEMYADVHYRLCSEYDVWVGLGVVGIAMELPIPRLYEHLVQGFKKSGLEEDDIEFFVRHGPMDVHHADLLIGSLTSQLHDDKDREALQAGARRSMDARFILMDGLYRVVFK